MTWSYRIIKTSGHYHDADGDQDWEHYAIHEVYYDDAGHPTGWSEDSVGAIGDSLDELRRDLDRMREALTRPVLVVNDDDKLEEVR